MYVHRNKISLTASLSVERLEEIEACMQLRECNRSEAIEYLIKMGHLYIDKVLPAQEKQAEDSE